MKPRVNGRAEPTGTSRGPLHGVRIVEFAGLGPTPFAAMLLSDLGADIVTICRVPGGSAATHASELGQLTDNALARGRRSIAIDLKTPEGVDTAIRLTSSADALIEGFRPGVMERLGLGPAVCLAQNPRLVYGRMTGWGQSGPLSQRAGHDINYISIAGVLEHLGPGDLPAAPLNLVADFGGGGMLLAYGIVAALFETTRSGVGQVVDAAMVDGSSLLMTMMYELWGKGLWDARREANMNDGGAHFYGVYKTLDARHVSIAAMEPQFYAVLLDRIGLDAAQLPAQWDRSRWPEMREKFASLFRMKTQDEWSRVFDGHDACYTPVLSMEEAISYRHNVERHAFVDVDGIAQPAPAPRFSRTPAAVGRGGAAAGQHTVEILNDYGFEASEISTLLELGTVTVGSSRSDGNCSSGGLS